MKDNEKMIMTEKLANQLIDDLMLVALSATGGVIQDANGNFDQEQIAFACEYARNTFSEILEAWEYKTGKEWGIGE